MLDPEREAERLLSEIESQYPPSRCSLEQYRDVIEALVHEASDRLQQLKEEIECR